MDATDALPSCVELGLAEDGAHDLQKVGRSEGLKLLHSLLYERGERYTKDMSSPVTAFESCSRLSAHLAFGTLSIREVFQAYEKRNYDIYPSSFKMQLCCTHLFTAHAPMRALRGLIGTCASLHFEVQRV